MQMPAQMSMMVRIPLLNMPVKLMASATEIAFIPKSQVNVLMVMGGKPLMEHLIIANESVVDAAVRFHCRDLCVWTKARDANPQLIARAMGISARLRAKTWHKGRVGAASNIGGLTVLMRWQASAAWTKRSAADSGRFAGPVVARLLRRATACRRLHLTGMGTEVTAAVIHHLVVWITHGAKPLNHPKIATNIGRFARLPVTRHRLTSNAFTFQI